MIYLVTNNRELFNNESYKIIDVENSLKLLEPLTVVGLDTETTGLDPWTCDLKILQLGCFDFQIVIDTSTINISLYKEYLESNRVFLGWNLKFDLKFLFKYNIVVRQVWDGFLAECLMWLGYPRGYHSMSLKSAGEEYLNIELDKSVRGKIMYAGLTEDVIMYSANDVKYLEQIMNKQKKALEEKGLQKAIVYENKFVIPLAYCEYCGVKLDIEKWKAKIQKDTIRVNNALEACNKWILENESNSSYIFIDRQGDLFNGFNLEPQVTLNWNSAKQLIPLFKKYGVNVTIEDRKKGGEKDSIDVKSLKPQKDKCSLIPLYLEYKKAVKITSTYGETFIKQINPISGRIHTNFGQLFTSTGRLNSGGKDKINHIEYVNMQNLPSDEETRACFVAEKGNSWISIDYSGEESFLMASIANDKAMLDELIHGDKDLHTLTAKIVFSDIIPKDCPTSVVTDKYHDLRKIAKGYEFAFNYNGNAETIKRNFGLSEEEANRIYNAYMKGFNGLKAYQERKHKEWWDKGYILISSITGHKSYIHNYKELKEDKEWMSTLDWEYYKEMKKTNPECATVQRVKNFFKQKSAWDRYSSNYEIQGTGAIIFKVASVYFFDYIVKNNLFNVVKFCIPAHDEWNVEAPKDIAPKVAEVLHQCMIKAGSFFCTRCKLDAKISYNEDGSLPTCWVH